MSELVSGGKPSADTRHGALGASPAPRAFLGAGAMTAGGGRKLLGKRRTGASGAASHSWEAAAARAEQGAAVCGRAAQRRLPASDLASQPRRLCPQGPASLLSLPETGPWGREGVSGTRNQPRVPRAAVLRPGLAVCDAPPCVALTRPSSEPKPVPRSHPQGACVTGALPGPARSGALQTLLRRARQEIC